MLVQPTSSFFDNLESNILQKGKARFPPVAGHTGPEGKWRYSSTLSWPRP
jgi:hypothetical protein